jgi:hypothetical protein
MPTHPSLNETDTLSEEMPDISHQNGISRLTITAWLCLLWVFVAFYTFWATIDNIDVDGALKTKFQPYELLIDCVFFSGLVTIPVGIGCGLLVLFNRKNYGLPLLPTLILGLVLTGLVYNQYQTYQWWIQFNNNPPGLVEIDP